MTGIFITLAGAAGLNAGWYAHAGDPINLGAAVFCGLCAIGSLLANR